MYKKLDLSLSHLDLVKLQGKQSWNTGTFAEFPIIDTNYLFVALSKQVQFSEVPQVNITEIKYPGVEPHTDTWQSAINFYFDVGDDETLFWREINPSSRKKGLMNYDPKNLELIDTFKANKDDCYLLDVGTSIHSVIMHKPAVRRILRLFWHDLPFDKALQSLKFLQHKS